MKLQRYGSSTMEGFSGIRKSNAGLKNFDVAVVILSTVMILSPIGSNFLLVIGGNFYPELAIFALFAYIYTSKNNELRRYVTSIARSELFLFWLLICIICFVLGIILQGSPIEAYSSLRGVMFAVVAYSSAKMAEKNRYTFEKYIKVVRLSSITMMASSILYFVLISGGGTKKPYSIPCLVIIVLTSVWGKKISGFGLFALVSFFVGITSGYRALILYSLLLIFAASIDYTGFILFIRRGRAYLNVKAISFTVISIVGLSLSGALLYQTIFDWISSDPSRYHQIIYKFEVQYQQIINGEFDRNSDQRLAFYSYLTSHWTDFLLPSGFYDRSDPTMFSLWGSDSMPVGGGSPINDGVALFMSMSFGLLLTSFAAIRLLFAFAKALPFKRMELVVRDSALMLILVMLSLTMGNLILVVGQAFFFGLALSLLTSRRALQIP